MASKKIFTNKDGSEYLVITRLQQGAMSFVIVNGQDPNEISTSIVLTRPDLSDLQRDLYAYLNFSKHA